MSRCSTSSIVWSWTHWDSSLWSSSRLCLSTYSLSSLWRKCLNASSRLCRLNINTRISIHPYRLILSSCLCRYIMTMSWIINKSRHSKSSFFCLIFITWHSKSSWFYITIVTSFLISISISTIFKGIIFLKSKLTSNSIPILIKPLIITRVHVFKMIITIEMWITYLFFNNFPASIIKHPFVTCFLNSILSIFIHLMSIYYSISTTSCSMGACLINLFYWSTILIHCCLRFNCLLNELSLTKTTSI